MQLEIYGNNKTSTSSVDWDGLNNHILETAQLEDPEVLIGVVSAMINLGTQVPRPSEFLWEGTDKEKAEQSTWRGTRFETYEYFYHKGEWLENVVVKVVENRPQQLIALLIDFPEIEVNIGQFFGDEDSKPAPLRMLLGGERWNEEEREFQVGTPLSFQARKNANTNNQWSVPFNSTLYKMVLANKGISQGQRLDPASDPQHLKKVTELLGKSFQFEALIFTNKGGYLQQRCRFTGALARGQQPLTIERAGMVNFNSHQGVDLKTLPNSVKNSIKRADQYIGSKINQLFDEIEGGSAEDNEQEIDSVEQPKKEAAKETKPRSRRKPLAEQKPAQTESYDEFDDFDNDIPF